MMKENETTRTMQSKYVSDAQSDFDQWRDKVEELDERLRGAGEDVTRKFDEQMTSLKNLLQDIEKQLDEIKLTDPETPDKQRIEYQNSLMKFEQAYGAAIVRMQNEGAKSAGWLTGFTDRPPAGSAGWLEGTGAVAEGSEGWVEGTGERGPKSRGWTEGYNASDN